MPKHDLPELDAALIRHTKDKSLQRQVDRILQEVALELEWSEDDDKDEKKS